MKLAKLIKQIDTMNDCVLFDTDINKVVWEGNTLDLDAAINDTSADIEDYFRECKEENDIKTIASVKSAMKYADYVLDRNDDGDSVMFFPYINQHGVACLKMQINIKKKKKEKK